jgi:hypothetical protein
MAIFSQVLINAFTFDECGLVSPLLISFLSSHLDFGTDPGQPVTTTPINE